jgi:hypothetical protein
MFEHERVDHLFSAKTETRCSPRHELLCSCTVGLEGIRRALTTLRVTIRGGSL